MFIKEVKLVGFRSYRDETSIDSFARGHNVVVGRNGSGKSNFFFAIQFVLSDEFSHLKAEQRLSVLHEGTGPKIATARVEIVFDNSDKRIAAIENTEVRVVRQVGQKKDNYYIDGKLVNRAEVVNLMESAGFSRSNPYYIVKQGKINELATSPDSHRLKLLREVAGTRVYDERKEESMKILKETQAKTEKVTTLLQYIDDRLHTLEEEKEDLKEYQKWDKTKRAIEYTVYDTDINECRRKLDKLADQREEFNARQNKVNTQLMDVQARGVKAAAEQRKLDSRFKGMKEEKEAIVAEEQEKFEKKTELELLVADLREDVEKEKSGRNVAEDKLNALMNEIAEKQSELEKITPEFKKLVEDEATLASAIRIGENRCKELFSKQGQRDQFATTEERDSFLRREVRQIQRQMGETEDRIKDVEKGLEDDDVEKQNMEASVGQLRIDIEENHMLLDKANTEHGKLKMEHDKAVVSLLDANREEKSVRDQLQAMQNEIGQMEHQMKHIVPRSTMNGVESVRRVVNWFTDQNVNGKNDDVINGYYGTLIELMACDSIYYQAVEVVAGNRMFYHVVSDDRVATKILQQVNRQQLPGECNFFPLNRLHAPQRRNTRDTDARPMLDFLSYEDAYDAVFRLVFAGTAIVRDMQAGGRLSKEEGFDCVTLEGDQVSRRGALTGGFLDVKRSKLEVHHNMRSLEDQKMTLQDSVEEVQRRAAEKQTTVEKIRLEIDKVENSMRGYKDKHRHLTEKSRYINEQLHSMSRSREPKEGQLLNLKNRLHEMDVQKANIEADIGQALQSQLTTSEQEECNKLQVELKQKKHELEQLAKKRGELENTKNRIENQLRTNLLRKKDNLSAKINDISVDEKRHNLQAESAEVKSIEKRLHEIQLRKIELDENLQEYIDTADKLTRELEAVQEQQKDLEAQVTEFAKQADFICTNQSTLHIKREESLKKVRELGSIPTEAYSKYQGMSSKQLEKKLAECVGELKKYANVNKKALDQFVQAASQKEELTNRMDEQIRNETSITDLLGVLETRKYDAIQLTFKQVSKNFQDVFQKLVPSGQGSLVIQTSGATQPGDTEKNIVEKFTGIGIKVSFNGMSETREMQQLSGGQKSLVALALIFAIQKCDPAPFYLFDEIDAALDAQHRKAVADMIHEQANDTQFITTTFRPELLNNAERYYGVRFRNKVSHIDAVTKEQAYDFVEDDQTHG